MRRILTHRVKGAGCRYLVVGLLVTLAAGVVTVGCFGGGDDSETVTTFSVGPASGSDTTTTLFAEDIESDENAGLSTFRSKDPFIQQAQPPVSTTATTSGGSPGATGGSSTTVRPGSSTTTTKAGGGSTTTTVPASTTSTTAPHAHTLKVLSIAEVGGKPAVTFQVDGSVYRDKRIGDVVSTSWGQIKVLDISTTSRVTTLLHGSETVVLSVGQVIYE
jgi:hypothetical protein